MTCGYRKPMPTAETVLDAVWARVSRWLRRVGHLLWRLIVTTVASCMRHRVTGLAGEAAFFAVLSVPPLIFALAGAIGYVSDRFSAAQVADVRDAVIDLSRQALTESAVARRSLGHYFGYPTLSVAPL